MNMKKLLVVAYAVSLLLISIIVVFVVNTSTTKEDLIPFENTPTEDNDFILVPIEYQVWDEVISELTPSEIEYPCMIRTIHNYAWEKIDSISNLRELPLIDMPFIDDKTFNAIKSIYAEVEFIGVFETGDKELYGLFLREFYRLLTNERTFYREGVEYYLDMHTRSCNESNLECYCLHETLRTYTYYFFDVDGDGTPELIISRGYPQLLQIFKYLPDEDVILSYFIFEGSGMRLNGTRSTIQWHASQNSLSFRRHSPVWLLMEGYRTIEERTGTFEHVYFHHIDQPEDWCGWVTLTDEDMWTSIYIVTLWIDSSFNHLEITNQMLAASIVTIDEGVLYFRVSEYQFYDINSKFLDAWDSIYERRSAVRFSFDELFGHYKGQPTTLNANRSEARPKEIESCGY